MPSLRQGSARPHGPGPGRGRGGTNLGPGYHKLWSATAVSTLGDGVFLTALPLLAATLSRDPLPVSLVASAGWLQASPCWSRSGSCLGLARRCSIVPLSR